MSGLESAGEPVATIHVRPSRPGEPIGPQAPVEDLTGGARPLRWFGAEAVGGLALPAAMPTASQLYAPRGVWLDDGRLIAADTGNHRILIWDSDLDATTSHQPAEVVLGQPDFSTEGAQAAGRGPERGMRLPTGVIVVDGRLIVADAWNHRILIWDEVPTTSDVAPDVVLGQRSMSDVEENRGGNCGPTTLYWPFGIGFVDGVFYVADTGNRRVLAWSGLPRPDQEPDVVLGQSDPTARDENRGELGPSSFRWPHDIAGTSDIVYIADAGNHRLLGWKQRPERDRDADVLHGQPDFATASEFPYGPQSATGLRFPYAIDTGTDTGTDTETDGNDGSGLMAVADTANNRILLWDGVPDSSGVPAHRVLGQPTFAANGENRWDAVTDDTFCWPYGISVHNGRLAVADSGNNRIMVWDLR